MPPPLVDELRFEALRFFLYLLYGPGGRGGGGGLFIFVSKQCRQLSGTALERESTTTP